MSKEKTDLSKYIVNVQGKDFITFPGLLAEAHSQGLTEINTELITPLDTNNPIVKATVKLGEKSFTGYGDANANNVAKKVAGALIRMAETRAVARALRFACNIDMTALEELDVEGDSNKVTSKSTSPKTFSAPVVKASETVEVKVENSSTNGEVVTKTTIAPKATIVANDSSQVSQKFTPVAVKPASALPKRTRVINEPKFP